MVNLYQGQPGIFINDNSGTPYLAENFSIPNQTWVTIKLVYENTGVYKFYIDGVIKGSYTIERETQKYTSIHQVLIMSPDSPMKRRNMYIYEGVV